jgi:isocitrate/isopropylmalate dehydrogenase
MFGDIITDLASTLQGGMGLAPAGNIGDKYAMFEPIHGSAPKYKGLGIVNPIATIWAGSMLLDHIGEHNAASAVLSSIEKASGKVSKRKTWEELHQRLHQLVRRVPTFGELWTQRLDDSAENHEKASP